MSTMSPSKYSSYLKRGITNRKISLSVPINWDYAVLGETPAVDLTQVKIVKTIERPKRGCASNLSKETKSSSGANQIWG